MPSLVKPLARFAAACALAWSIVGAGGWAQPVHAQAADFVNGISVDHATPRSMKLAREAGFPHVKMVVYWPRMQQRTGELLWDMGLPNDVDNMLAMASQAGLKLILRVDGVPAWAGGSPATADLAQVEAFHRDLAAYVGDRAVAYEILNEPNLDFEWGGPPDPAAYARFVKAAHRGVKAGNASALVVGGGPAPNTGGAPGTVEDLEFIQGMYDEGIKGYLDALAVHNYGGNFTPEQDPQKCSICFRRAEIYRALMVKNGDSATPIWATEFGWLMDPGRDIKEFNWMRVSAEEQADYIVRAYQYSRQHWPWMSGMLLANLDASTTDYHEGGDDGFPWFSLVNQDYSPRLAYTAFKDYATAQEARGGWGSWFTSRSEPSALAVSDTKQLTAAPGQPRMRVSGTGGTGVVLRSDPSTLARRIDLVREGVRVEVVGPEKTAEGRAWRNVRLPDGRQGWVAAVYLQPAD
ncbi:MAG: cellulase family glycosylhydrolase [Chloroflexota bacterium]